MIEVVQQVQGVADGTPRETFETVVMLLTVGGYLLAFLAGTALAIGILMVLRRGGGE